MSQSEPRGVKISFRIPSAQPVLGQVLVESRHRAEELYLQAHYVSAGHLAVTGGPGS